MWGFPPAYRFLNILSLGYPQQFLRWYFTTGMLRRDPVFAEWLRTREPVIWSEVARQFPRRFDPEFSVNFAQLQLIIVIVKDFSGTRTSHRVALQ